MYTGWEQNKGNENTFKGQKQNNKKKSSALVSISGLVVVGPHRLRL